MMHDQSWTLTLTPPGRPASRRTGLSQDEMFEVLTSLMNGDTRAYTPEPASVEPVAA